MCKPCSERQRHSLTPRANHATPLDAGQNLRACRREWHREAGNVRASRGERLYLGREVLYRDDLHVGGDKGIDELLKVKPLVRRAFQHPVVQVKPVDVCYDFLHGVMKLLRPGFPGLAPHRNILCGWMHVFYHKCAAVRKCPIEAISKPLNRVSRSETHPLITTPPRGTSRSATGHCRGFEIASLKSADAPQADATCQRSGTDRETGSRPSALAVTRKTPFAPAFARTMPSARPLKAGMPASV